jgi:two-component system, NtrC family, sensor kinase
MLSLPIETASEVEVLTRMLERERAARKRAEQLMTEKCRELFQSHTEMQRTSKALAEEVRRSRAVFNTAAEGIVIFDSSGRIESCNLAAEQIFGIPSGCMELNICQLLPQAAFCLNNGQCLVSGLRRLLGESNETNGSTLDGSEIPLEFVISEFEANGATAFSGIVRDLSRRKQLEAKLAQAQKLESVGQLAAGIAHELNTPIQFVGNNTRFLKEAFETISQLFELYEQWWLSAKRSAKCHKFHAFSRPAVKLT